MVTVLSLPPQPRLLDVHALADLYGAQVERRWQAKESGRAPGPGLCFPRLAQALGSWMPSLGGWLEPGIIVIHGQPGSGKTALAHQISASCGQPALYLSADMPLVGLLRRHVARQTCQPKIGLLTGRVSPDQEYQMVVDALALTPDWAVVDGRTVPVEMEWLALALREHRGRHPSSMLVIDSLHAWAASLAAPDMSEYESLNAAVDAIKSLVEALDLPVIVLSERNRESAKSGGLGASRGSGRIEFAADVVIDLSVEDTEGQWSSRDVTLKLCKNRDGMAGHKIRYGFNGDTQTFSEWEHANDRS